MVKEKWSSSSSSSSGGGRPAWLEGLMAAETHFFGGCGVHLNRRKNEKNVFCFHCCLSICPHCLPSHTSHPLLQVRRYVYHDVVRLADLEKLIDCSYIQPYTINGAKVVFLKKRERAQSQSSSSSPSSSSQWRSHVNKGSANICFACDRILQHPFRFCSLSCKVEWLVSQGDDLSAIIYRFDASDFTISQFEGLRMQEASDAAADDDDDGGPNILEGPHHNSSGSHEATGDAASKSKKKNKQGPGPGLVPGILLGSRRKGAPHRAPLS